MRFGRCYKRRRKDTGETLCVTTYSIQCLTARHARKIVTGHRVRSRDRHQRYQHRSRSTPRGGRITGDGYRQAGSLLFEAQQTTGRREPTSATKVNEMNDTERKSNALDAMASAEREVNAIYAPPIFPGKDSETVRELVALVREQSALINQQREAIDRLKREAANPLREALPATAAAKSHHLCHRCEAAHGITNFKSHVDGKLPFGSCPPTSPAPELKPCPIRAALEAAADECMRDSKLYNQSDYGRGKASGFLDAATLLRRRANEVKS